MKFLNSNRVIVSLFVFLFIISGLWAQETTIMTLGNSITWGKLLREDPTVSGTHGYRDHLFNKLIEANANINFVGPQPGNPMYDAAHHDPPYEGYFRDGARVGYFLPDSLWDIKVMLDNMAVDSIPQHVILHLGTNDMLLANEIGDYQTPGTITYRLYRLLDILLNYSRGGKTIEHIFLCTIIPRGENESQGITYPEINQRIETYNAKIRAMYEDNSSWQLPLNKPRVELIDTHTLFYANMDNYFTPDIDPTHPNSNGYEALGEDLLFPVIYPFIIPGIIDDFNRAAGGLHLSNRWRATSSIRLSGTTGQTYDGVIYNNSTGTDWDNLAVWPLTENASTVELTFHEDAENFNHAVAIAVALSDTTPSSANGYMLWLAGTGNASTGGTLRLWTVINGQAASPVTQVTGVPYCQGGDVLRVNFRHNDDNGSNAFDVAINGSPVATVQHASSPLYSEPFYSGVIFRDGSGTPPTNAAMITDFTALFGVDDRIPPGQILSFDWIERNYNNVTLRWDATGDDAYDGTASRYDLRMSTSQMYSDSDIENAQVVSGVQAPLVSGTPETFVVRNLDSGQRYFFAIRAIDDWGNVGDWSQVVEVITKTREPIRVCFEDQSLWNFDSNDYGFDNRPGTTGEFTNLRSNMSWPQSVAVFKGAYNPSTVELMWGNEVTYGNPPSIDNGGVALMLNSDQPTADGYLIFVRTANQTIYLYTLSNGHADELIADVAYIIKDNLGNPKYPDADDTLKVVIDWTDPIVNRFDVYINGEQAGEGALYDRDKRHTGTGVKYAGIYLSGLYGVPGRNNNVRCFGTISDEGDISGLEPVCPVSNTAQVKTELPDVVQAIVRDSNNNPVPDWPVFFELTDDATGGTLSAPPVITDPIRMEGEWGKIEQVSSTILTPEHHLASRGKYVEFASGLSQSGYVEFNFYVAEQGDYYFWARVVAEAWNSSILWVQLDGTPSNINNGIYWSLDNNWSDDGYDFKWDRIRLDKGQPFHRQLNTGMHQLRIYKGHHGVKLDKILATRNSTYQPVSVDTVSTLLTDADGAVSTTWTLGEKAGVNTLRMRGFGITEEFYCTAYGIAAAPTIILPTSATASQSGAARDTLTHPFEVTLTDPYGNVTPDITVNWTVDQGDGVFAETGTQTFSTLTDSEGKASAEFVLGIMDSVNHVVATFSGYTGALFKFEGIVTSGLIRDIEVIQPAKAKHYVGSVLPNHVKVRILDDDDNPVQNVPVVFGISQGDADTGTQPKMTNANGIAQDTLTYGLTSSVVKVQAQISSLIKEVFMDSVYFKAKTIRLFSGQNANGLLGDTLQQRMKVQILDQGGFPLKDHPVRFRTTEPRDRHNWKFLGDKDSIEVLTSPNGVASATIRAPLTMGTYEDVVEALATDGFFPLQGDPGYPVKFTLRAESKASRLEKYSQDSTEGVVTEKLPDDIVVRMLDGQGQPVGFQPVTFTIESGNGHFPGMSSIDKDTVATTDSEGLAVVEFYLGPEPGEYNNIIKVTAHNGITSLFPTEGLFYRFSAKSSNADTLIRISNEIVSGEVDKTMQKLVQVKIADAGGWGVEGVSVTFSVLGGGGTLGGTDDTSKVVVSQSAEGISSVSWKLGPTAGTENNVLEAKAYNGDIHLKGSPLIFKASGFAATVDADSSSIETAGSTVASGQDTCWIVVTLRDRYRNPVSGKNVKIKVTGGTNYYNTQIGPTDANGQATAHLISPNSGEKIIEATVVGDNIKIAENGVVNFEPSNAHRIQPIYTPGLIGNVGTISRDSLAIKVTDAMGNPVANKRIYFEVLGDKGGSVTRSEAISNVDGIAATYIIFGQETGEYVVRAVANDPLGNPLDGSPALFSLSAKEGLPVSIFAVSGDGQEGPAGSVLSNQLIVGVRDEDGQAVAGVSVKFEVESGDGQIVTTTPTPTDMYGYAYASLRTGTQKGATCWVKASGANTSLSGAPVRFSATSTSGISSKIVKISGDEQQGKVGETLPNQLTVRVTDKYDNAVSGKTVTFEVVHGDAHFGGEEIVKTDVSDGAGLASMPLTLGYTTGMVIVEVSGSMLDGSPLTFTASVSTVQAISLDPISDLNQVASINNYLPSSLKVQVKDQHGNGVPDVSVYFTKDEGGGQLTDAVDQTTLGNQIAMSNENGVAAIQYKAGTEAGVARIRAISGVHTIQFIVDVRQNASLPVLNKSIISDAYSVRENDQLNPLNVLLSANDVDGNTLHFEVEHVGAASLPETMLLITESSVTARIRWVPGLEDAGAYEFIARVVDSNGGYDQKYFNVAVVNSPQPPEIITHVPVAQDTFLDAGLEHRFWIDARDPDYDPLNFSWTMDGSPVGDNSALLVWYVPQNLLGNHIVTATVTDGLLNDTYSWNVEVMPTAVELAEFYAEFEPRSGLVDVVWVTSSERMNKGYDIYRSTREEGEYIKINEDRILPSDDQTYRFVDKNAKAGARYFYKLVDIDQYDHENEHGPILLHIPKPDDLVLHQNYPNPFNPVTTIHYEVPEREHIRILIYNMRGQEVVTLLDQEMEPGYYQVEWNGCNASGRETSTGLYIYRLYGQEKMVTKRMVKMK